MLDSKEAQILVDSLYRAKTELNSLIQEAIRAGLQVTPHIKLANMTSQFEHLRTSTPTIQIEVSQPLFFTEEKVQCP